MRPRDGLECTKKFAKCLLNGVMEIVIWRERPYLKSSDSMSLQGCVQICRNCDVLMIAGADVGGCEYCVSELFHCL